MEEYGRYSSSWMWNLHQREDDYLYAGVGSGDGGPGARDVRGCEDFGNSLDQLNKIVERITPDGRNSLPKREIHSRRISLHESHFNDSAYETYLGYDRNDSTSEMIGDFPSHMTVYEGSSWSHSTCESYRGNAYPNMSDGRIAKLETLGAGRNLENKHDAIVNKKESKKESSANKLMTSNTDEGDRFDKCRSGKNFDESEGDEICVKTKRRAFEVRESLNTKHVEASEEQDGKQRMQSPGWSNSKQLLEIGKYTEAGGKNTNDATSPHNSIGHLTNYGESSMNYDSMSSLSVGGNMAYISPAEQTMSDCADAKLDDDMKLYTCSQCSYRAIKKGQLRKHMSVHGVFLCAHCEFSSEHGDSLEAHRRAHHPGLCGRKLCKKCRVLYQGDELKEHERMCSGEKQRWPCPTCNKEFKFLSVMKAHMRKWHPSAAASLAGDSNLIDGFPPMADSTTEEVTGGSDLESDQGLIVKSVLETEPESSFHCEDCDKVFKTKWMLSNHKVLHCTDAPFFCDTNGCSTTFRSDKELNVHRMKVHELGPKKYPCCHPDCSMQFAKYGHYKRHKLTHLVGERKFKCDWPNCGKAFSHTDNLKVHYRRHTDEKPYKCQRCESAYRQKSGLKYHMEKVHDEKSTGRPGRKRKIVGHAEEDSERPEIMRSGKVVSTDHEGRAYESYDCSVSSIMNGSDRGFGKMAAVELVKKSRSLSRNDEAGDICQAPINPMQNAEREAKREVEKEVLMTSGGEITSASNDEPGAAGCAKLGEIGLNDEWVIDEPFNDVDIKREKEEELEKSHVDSSSDFHCTSPKMEPLDVDLGEELRRLSDVIGGEIHLGRCAESEAPPTSTPRIRCLSEFITDERMDAPHEGNGLQKFATPLPMHRSYKNHPDLFQDMPSHAHDDGSYAAAKYKLSYNQFCCSSMPDDKASEMGAYSTGGYSDQLRPASSDPRLADPRAASERQIVYGDSGARAWMPPDAGTLDDASPASGRSTRSDLSQATSGDIADHYREAHTALLPTCSPVIQHQVSVDDDVHGSGTFVKRQASGTEPLPPSWSQSFEDEDEEDDDHEEDDEEEDEDDAAGDGQWTNQCENWCQGAFPDHPMSSKEGQEAPLSQAAVSCEIPMSDYSTNQSPLVWLTGKAHESAFSSRMHGTGYSAAPASVSPGWGIEDGSSLIGYRTPGAGSFSNGAYKRTSTYEMDKFSAGPGIGLRGGGGNDSYDTGARESNYYPGPHHTPPADHHMYRYYGQGGSYPHHQYGQTSPASYGLQSPGRAWNSLPPEDPGFLTVPPNARGSAQSPVYPASPMLYPAMPPYF